MLSDAFDGRLPFWFGRGLSAVLSNTIVTDRQVQFGRPIPWYIDELGQGRSALGDVLTMTRESPACQREVEHPRFDAQCWALVHYLVFGDADRAASSARLNALARMTLGGTPSVAAVEEVYGSVAKLDAAYRLYVERGLFRYSIMAVDARFQARAFRARPLPPAESLAARADYLAATSRFVEARAAISEARTTSPDLPGPFVAEARMLEREGKSAEARAAYERAVALGTDNFHAYVRLANLTPRPGATPETLATLRSHLTKAIELNGASGVAHQSLGGVLLQMNLAGEAIEALQKAVALEPLQGSAYVTLANALARAGRRDEALQAAQAGLVLARTDQQRAIAQQTLDRLKGG